MEAWRPASALRMAAGFFSRFFPGLFRVALRFFAEWAVHARKVNFAPATDSLFFIRNYWKLNSPSGNQDLERLKALRRQLWPSTFGR